MKKIQWLLWRFHLLNVFFLDVSSDRTEASFLGNVSDFSRSSERSRTPDLWPPHTFQFKTTANDRFEVVRADRLLPLMTTDLIGHFDRLHTPLPPFDRWRRDSRLERLLPSPTLLHRPDWLPLLFTYRKKPILFHACPKRTSPSSDITTSPGKKRVCSSALNTQPRPRGPSAAQTWSRRRRRAPERTPASVWCTLTTSHLWFWTLQQTRNHCIHGNTSRLFGSVTVASVVAWMLYIYSCCSASL